MQRRLAFLRCLNSIPISNFNLMRSCPDCLIQRSRDETPKNVLFGKNDWKWIKINCLNYLLFRLWDCVSDPLMEELTAYYQEFHPAMVYRHIRESATAPSDQVLDSYRNAHVTVVEKSSQFCPAAETRRVKGSKKCARRPDDVDQERRVSAPSSDAHSVQENSPPNFLCDAAPKLAGWSTVHLILLLYPYLYSCLYSYKLRYSDNW